MADYKFEFVVEGMTREQANQLGDIIEEAVNSIGLICGGNVRGMERTKWVKCINAHHAESLVVEGDIYQVFREEEQYYCVLTMVNHVGAMLKTRFIEVENDND